VTFPVCNDAAHFRQAIGALCAEARRRWPELPEVPPAALQLDDRFIGPGYAQATDEVLALIRRAARLDGVLLDPVYTAKAAQGLLARAGELGPRVIFVHTGGAFGVLPFAARLADEGGG
jgi:D-cysteine desulfhydrase